jgi:hypothetical protein
MNRLVLLIALLHPWKLVEWEQRSMAQQSQSMTVTGKLTDEGVECQAMRDDEGKLYTLTGDKRILEGFRTGERVKVIGHIAEASFCMQGTTLVVNKIERAK